MNTLWEERETIALTVRTLAKQTQIYSEKIEVGRVLSDCVDTVLGGRIGHSVSQIPRGV